jgi:hypothetical protein
VVLRTLQGTNQEVDIVALALVLVGEDLFSAQIPVPSQQGPVLAPDWSGLFCTALRSVRKRYPVCEHLDSKR